MDTPNVYTPSTLYNWFFKQWQYKLIVLNENQSFKAQIISRNAFSEILHVSQVLSIILTGFCLVSSKILDYLNHLQ